MSNNYSTISLKTSIEELDIPPRIKEMLEKEGITNVAELLIKAKEKPSSGKMKKKLNIIKQLADNVSRERPDLFLGLEDFLIGKTSLTGFQQHEVFNYISRLKQFFENGDLESLLLPGYVVESDEKTLETELARLVKKSRELNKKYADLSKKKTYIKRQLRIIDLGKDK